MTHSILENTHQPLVKSKRPRRLWPLAKMDFSEEGRKRNEILKESKIWVNLDPSIPCVANGRRKGIRSRRGSQPENREERLAFYFQHIQVDENGCWLWTKNSCCDGYGRIRWQARTWKVNRFAWLMHFGDPGKMEVCHECDVRLCSNPEHLFLGTHKDNMRDMSLKMRHDSRYNPRDILRARNLRIEGMTYPQIEVETGIPANHVGKIIRGELWSYVSEEWCVKNGV